MVVDEDELIQLPYLTYKISRKELRKYPLPSFSLRDLKLIWPELEGLLDL